MLYASRKGVWDEGRHQQPANSWFTLSPSSAAFSLSPLSVTHTALQAISFLILQLGNRTCSASITRRSRLSLRAHSHSKSHPLSLPLPLSPSSSLRTGDPIFHFNLHSILPAQLEQRGLRTPTQAATLLFVFSSSSSSLRLTRLLLPPLRALCPPHPLRSASSALRIRSLSCFVTISNPCEVACISTLSGVKFVALSCMELSSPA